MRSAVRLGWALILLAAVAAPAQIVSPDPVPTDHYGPPACARGRPNPVTAEASARAEQQQGLALDHALPSAEPLENFALLRDRLTAYGDCVGSNGCYWADLDAQYRRAELALAAEMARGTRGERLAIVMDIDETSLTNYCEMRREDFGYIKPLYEAWTLSRDAGAGIPGAVRLFEEARAAGVAVFFITGRPGKPNPSAPTHPVDERAATERNLKLAGFHDWTGLVLRDGAENGMPTVQYKSAERQRIVDQGYRVILSVGDQWSDLLGVPQAEVSVKLPNPFYFIP